VSEQEQIKQGVNTHGGWNHLMRSLGVDVPNQLKQSQLARRGIQTLIRTGR
jgi:hypothetical protein